MKRTISLFFLIVSLLFSVSCQKETPSAAISSTPATEEVVITVDTTGKKFIALTFDDGPNDLFKNYFRLFSKHNAHATFYILGGYVDGGTYDSLLTSMHKAGMEFGNHSYSHRNFPYLTDEEILDELSQTETLLSAATGAEMKTARLPTMMGDDRIFAAVAEKNYIWVGSVRYDINDSITCPDTTPDSIAQKVIESAYDGAIYCLHATSNTYKALNEQILPTLEKQGYAFVTVSELLALKGPENLPKNVSIRDAYGAVTDEDVSANRAAHH